MVMSVKHFGPAIQRMSAVSEIDYQDHYEIEKAKRRVAMNRISPYLVKQAKSGANTEVVEQGKTSPPITPYTAASRQASISMSQSPVT